MFRCVNYFHIVKIINFFLDEQATLAVEKTAYASSGRLSHRFRRARVTRIALRADRNGFDSVGSLRQARRDERTRVGERVFLNFESL